MTETTLTEPAAPTRKGNLVRTLRCGDKVTLRVPGRPVPIVVTLGKAKSSGRHQILFEAETDIHISH